MNNKQVRRRVLKLTVISRGRGWTMPAFLTALTSSPSAATSPDAGFAGSATSLGWDSTAYHASFSPAGLATHAPVEPP